MKPVLSFSGWGQHKDALLPILPAATPFDYMRYADIHSACTALRGLPCQVAVGWSLGGQVLLRAILAGAIQPEKIILLAVPFCFSHSQAEIFYHAVEANPALALQRFRLMVAEGDSTQKQVARGLMQAEPSPHLLYWLRALYDFDGSALKGKALPPALILHGECDRVVPVSQAETLASLFPHVQLVRLKGTAHAPHLHDRETIRQLIAEYVA